MAVIRWKAVAALIDPVRRALYDHVRRQDHPVTREEASDAVDISRNLTAFHLDKLVEAGLLRARYEAPPSEPRGRGRTPKVYETTGDGLSLTVPPRQYELVGEILADAVAAAPEQARATAQRHAFERGRDIGTAARPSSETAGDGADELGAAHAALLDLGFEPRTDQAVTLGNCPFHQLARRQTELICDLNHQFIRGLLAGLGSRTLQATLAPQPVGCCVRIESSTR